ncbi:MULTISPECIES: dUTP diphosphatase [unclassified Janthinobacterium]|uniref:dUTP diphosphatase n=1 Tax=unclassified Janthinobacterium TaxID=2610881 RepID=UPI001E3EA218|nr:MULTISPECIES: dUTP diphosphatase [unclassified Janthinobacterium]MCC7641635.1 dUTP diphosphatase [Janthinobacterium sp. EB271-G4-3-1]MCC7690888.1 dUTP diphosphatase [Janthinobacterium sp. EB271-G4-3-2]
MNKLNIKQLQEILRLQASMNEKINENWLTAGYPFLRAVVIEAGEALEHAGWKWWKKQEHDLVQVRIELIDILHFYLSAILIEVSGDIELASQSVLKKLSSSGTVQFDGRQYILREKNLLELLELLAGLAAARRLEVGVLDECFKQCGLEWTEVINIYISKNVLNIFRQDHGYKDGTYIKIWNGEEDNVVLARLANSVSKEFGQFSTALYTALKQEYVKIVSIS